MATRLSVTELVRGFSDYVNRVTYRGERFILVRGRKPVAELRPIAIGRSLGELEELLRGLPALTAAEADDFGADLDAARAQMPAQGPGDPWAS